MTSITIPPWIEKTIEKTVMTLQNDVIKKKIQILILDPFMSYIIERLFPYVLLLVVCFAIMILLSVATMATVLYKVSVSSVSQNIVSMATS
jgi:hypothetical protein